MKGNKDHSVLETVLGTAEVIVDVITSNEFLAEIPIIGTAFGFARAADSIRDRAFMAKLTKFVSALGSMDHEDIEKYKDKLHTDPKESERVGETLFLILERVTDLEKPTILAEVFIAYLDGIVSSEKLRRIAQAIDIAFTDDLEKLLKIQDQQGTYFDSSSEPWIENLSLSGLTRRSSPKPGTPVSVSSFQSYEISPLGYALIRSHLHKRSL